MRLPPPKFQHPPEIYAAILQEHGGCALPMARCLQAGGWSLADAAWAAVHWDLSTLAAAIANQRCARGAKLIILAADSPAKPSGAAH